MTERSLKDKTKKGLSEGGIGIYFCLLLYGANK